MSETVDPLNMHTDAHTEGDVTPFNMHTDAAGGNATPFNMHTDMIIGGTAHGGLTLSAKNGTGAALAVTITAGMAGKLGAVLGLPGAPAANPHAPAPVAPFNMHTDARTRITANETGSKATLHGPAQGPRGPETLRVTIDGPALATVKGSHPGI